MSDCVLYEFVKRMVSKNMCLASCFVYEFRYQHAMLRLVEVGWSVYGCYSSSSSVLYGCIYIAFAHSARAV